MIHIVGDGIIPEAQCMYDVRDALEFEQDVYLLSHLAPVLGIEIKGKVIYNMEPLSDDCRSFSVGYLDVLRQNTVIDYSQENVKYLKTLGIRAFYMPYGYHDGLVRPVEEEKTIDVLFVGSFNARRSRLLDGLAGLVWVTGVYGDDLDRMVAKAKVVLNIHYSDSHPLEVARINYLMANHCNVVSEKGNDKALNDQYAEGLHFCEEESIKEVCLFAVDNAVDGQACIKKIPQDCTSAQQWLNSINEENTLCRGQQQQQ